MSRSLTQGSRWLWALAAAGVAVGCARPEATVAAAPSAACEARDASFVRDLLYFGRNRPNGGEVADAEWEGFLDEVVTPKFPDGLTIVEAHGRWRGRSGIVEHERTELVTVLHPADSVSQRAVEEIAMEYKRHFGQEAVLRERLAVCTRFF
ncbi:MAG TPA: DUF3574 domain-containing protein [Gemmatimonadales bacterium]|nr:DUF3574 domain-containing protein [Gemmatimonadales bacterium]